MNFRNIFIAVAAISLAACNNNETTEQKAETTPVYKEETVAYTGPIIRTHLNLASKI